MFASPEKALDERTIGHNPERLSLMKASMLPIWHAFHFSGSLSPCWNVFACRATCLLCAADASTCGLP